MPNTPAGSPAASGANPAAAAVPAEVAVPAAAGAAAKGNFTAATKIASVNDLREKAPKVWNAMCQGIAQNICIESQHYTDRLKKMMREASEPND